MYQFPFISLPAEIEAFVPFMKRINKIVEKRIYVESKILETYGFC